MRAVLRLSIGLRRVDDSRRIGLLLRVWSGYRLDMSTPPDRRCLALEAIEPPEIVVEPEIAVPPIDDGPGRMPAGGGVYFIECHGFVKIGRSWSVADRLNSLLFACPLPMRPLGYIACDTYLGAIQKERSLHLQFSALRHRGEWFRYDQAILDFVSAECVSWPAAGAR